MTSGVPIPPAAAANPIVRAIAQAPLGLGTAPLAGLFRAPVPDDVAQAALQAAWDGGIRFFDTAPHYGTGLAERRLGEFLRTIDRTEAVVSTKVGRILLPGYAPVGEGGFFNEEPLVRRMDYTRDGIRRSLEDSLTRTGLDRMDMVLIHDPDDHWEAAIGQAYPALAALRDQGVIGAIGVGMNQTEMLTRFVADADLDVVLIAGRYTLLDQGAAEKLFPACQERGVAVIAGGVFNSGVLVEPAPGAYFDYSLASDCILARAQRMQADCAEYGIALAAAAIQFPTRHPAVTSVLVGARTPDEVRQDLAWANVSVPEAMWQRLASR